jgi:hypothetical protein
MRRFAGCLRNAGLGWMQRLTQKRVAYTQNKNSNQTIRLSKIIFTSKNDDAFRACARRESATDASAMGQKKLCTVKLSLAN